jgi:glutathione S-transferase
MRDGPLAMPATGPTLYHVPKTIFSPIYQILLHLHLTPDVIQVKTLTFSDLKSPQHLDRNPMGTSPAFTDDQEGIAIWESGAVLSYILQMYDTSYQLHPNPKSCSKLAFAKFLHVQQFIIATLYPFIASSYIHTLVIW